MSKSIANVAVAVLALAGCGTLANTFEEEPGNRIYVGLRADLGAIGHGGLLDLPFYFVLDTILLPYTIPKTIANRSAVESVGKPEDMKPADGIGEQE